MRVWQFFRTAPALVWHWLVRARHGLGTDHAGRVRARSWERCQTVTVYMAFCARHALISSARRATMSPFAAARVSPVGPLSQEEKP
jgi:hypothetical protein